MLWKQSIHFYVLVQDMSGRIKYVCEKEGITLKDDHVMTSLQMVAGGDLRKAITTLQSAVRLDGVNVQRQANL